MKNRESLLTCAVVVVCFVLIIIAFLTPFWIVETDAEGKYIKHEGIYMNCTHDKCDRTVMEGRVMPFVVFGLFGGALATWSSMIYSSIAGRHSRRYRTHAQAVAAYAMLAGILSTAATFTCILTSTNEAGELGFSFYLATCGSVTAVLAGIALLVVSINLQDVTSNTNLQTIDAITGQDQEGDGQLASQGESQPSKPIYESLVQ